jgi:hypothetical protein
MSEATEGWGVIRPGDRKAHYYRETTSLCRRVGFYFGPLDAGDQPSPDDCAACRRALGKEKSKAAPVSTATPLEVTVKER